MSIILLFSLLFSSTRIVLATDLLKMPEGVRYPPDHFVLKLPPKKEESAPVVIEEKVIEKQPEPEPIREPITWVDPQAEIKAQQKKRALERRRFLQKPLAVKAQKTDITAEERHTHDPHYRFWDDRAQEDKWTYAVDRNWVLTADMSISGILQSRIDSTIGGRVIIVIDHRIFAATGNNEVFPRYTKLICEYQPLGKVSDTKLPLQCIRAIRPDGANLWFTDAHGMDQMGSPGLIGEINHKTIEKYGSAFSMAAISSLASAGTRVGNTPLLHEGAANLSQNLGQVTANIIEQNIDLAPVITIPAGSRVQLQPYTDIWLRKPISKREALSQQKRIQATQEPHTSDQQTTQGHGQ